MRYAPFLIATCSTINAAQGALVTEGLSQLAQKLSEANIPAAAADTMGKADELFKNSILPAAEAGLNHAKEKINQVDLGKSVADAVELSQSVMENSKLATGAAVAAVPLAKEHLSHVNVRTTDLVEKTGEVVAADGPTAAKTISCAQGNPLAQVEAWVKENPVLAVCAATGALGVGIAAAPSIVTAQLLAAAGVVPGVGASSLAAAAQSLIGNVAAGSAFALFQSAGAGGAGLAVVNAVVHGAGIGVAGGAAGIAGQELARSNRKQDTGEPVVEEYNEKKSENKPGKIRSKL